MIRMSTSPHAPDRKPFTLDPAHHSCALQSVCLSIAPLFPSPTQHLIMVSSLRSVVLCTAALLLVVAAARPAVGMMHRWSSSPEAGSLDASVLPGPVQYFTQKQDHFDPLNTNTFQQRFTVDDSKWQPGGPVFFFLSGEGTTCFALLCLLLCRFLTVLSLVCCTAPMEFFEFQEVSAINWAHEFGAMYISLEHRFYGETSPVPGTAPSHHLHAMFTVPHNCLSSPICRLFNPQHALPLLSSGAVTRPSPLLH